MTDLRRMTPVIVTIKPPSKVFIPNGRVASSGRHHDLFRAAALLRKKESRDLIEDVAKPGMRGVGGAHRMPPGGFDQVDPPERRLDDRYSRRTGEAAGQPLGNDRHH